MAKKLLFAFFLLISVYCYAENKYGPDVQPVYNSSGSTTIAVASTDTAYTQSIDLKGGEYFAVAYKAASDGEVNLKIEMEQSFQVPTTEGSSDTMWVEPGNASDIESALADENFHINALGAFGLPVPLHYGRFKITGQGSNDASTTISIWLNKQDG